MTTPLVFLMTNDDASHEYAVLYICVENCANNFAESSGGEGGKVGGGGVVVQKTIKS
jgi:hypothetical protein